MQEEAQAKQRAASSSKKANATKAGSPPSVRFDVSPDGLEAELEKALPTDTLLQHFIDDAIRPRAGSGGTEDAIERTQRQTSGFKGGGESGQQAPGRQTDAEAPLQEDERNALLSEWYSLTGKKQPAAGGRASSAPSPTSSPPASRHSTSQRPSQDFGLRRDSSAPQTAAGQPETKTSAEPFQEAKEVSRASSARSEEDAYVSAVLRNLEIVSSKVEAAEAKMAKAVALAKAGDPAAKAASAAASAQLEPLREQLAQLKLLKQSLKDLSEGQDSDSDSDVVLEREPSRRRETEGQSEVRVAEIVEGPNAERPSASPLPQPSVISGAPPAPASRGWGSWGRNQRIKDADVALIKERPVMSSRSGVQPGAQETGSVSAISAAAAGSNAHLEPTSPAASSLNSEMRPPGSNGKDSSADGSVTIVNKKSGKISWLLHERSNQRLPFLWLS